MVIFETLNKDKTVTGQFKMSNNQTDKELLIGKEFLESYSGKGSNTIAYRLLKLIFDLACSENPSRDDTNSVIFSWRDFQEPDDVSDDGARLKKHLRKAIKKWDLHTEALNQRAFDQQLAHYPIIELAETGGGAGNLTKYKIKLVPTSSSSAVDKTALKEGYIGYTAEVSDTTNPFIKLVDGLTAKGINFYVLVGTMTVAAMIGVFSLWAWLYLISQQTTTFELLNTTMNFGLIVGGLYLFFSPVYYCITRRIIIAPFILSLEKNCSSQIEYAPTGELHDNGKTVRQFKIISYVGKCLVCGGRVDVEKGEGRMSGRLVGRCSESPIEHEYTFDHKTKIGKLIHEEYLDVKAL
ncbi:MAG: hypothetical protein ACJAZ4_002162 [Neptuniibacter pectenicola]